MGREERTYLMTETIPDLKTFNSEEETHAEIKSESCDTLSTSDIKSDLEAKDD